MTALGGLVDVGLVDVRLPRRWTPGLTTQGVMFDVEHRSDLAALASIGRYVGTMGSRCRIGQAAASLTRQASAA